MTGIVVSLLILAAPPPQAGPAEPAVSAHRPAAPLTTAQWRERVHLALRGEATAKELERPAAVLQLTALYRELSEDCQLSASERKALTLKVRRRLLRLREDIPVDMALRLAKIDAVKARATEEKRPELLAKIEHDEAVVGKWKDMLAQFGVGAVGQGAVGVNVQAQQGATVDDGEVLVDIIEQVITPDFWDVNGGPGKVVYFRSLRALVVSATTEQHGGVGALLDGLREAGN